MKKILCLGLLLVNLFGAYSQRESKDPEPFKRPKLIVNIAIDGLRSDYLAMFWQNLGEKGFRRLIQNGTYCPNITYPYLNVGNPADYASVFTGTTPSDHGICGENYWDSKTYKELSYLFDPDTKAIGGTEQISPRNLQSSTFVDELKLNTQGRAKVITIGMNSEESCIMAGHGANPTVWLDDNIGTWASSEYYGKRLPSWAMKMNIEMPASNYMRQNWANLHYSSRYRANSSQSRATPLFAYSIETSNNGKEAPYKEFKESPFANSMVLDLAMNAVREEYIGLDDFPDVLNLQFTVRAFNQVSTGALTAEIQDMYFRLDEDLARLTEMTDKLCGSENVLYIIFAPQKEYTTPEVLQSAGVPSGYFVADRSMALLNSYLMANYGQGDFVHSYRHKQIFLNKEEIEEKNINLEEFEQDLTSFMTRFQGVQYAFQTKDLQQMIAAPEPRIQMLRNSFDSRFAGDIILFLKPGWVEVPDETEKIGISTRVNNYAPFIISGWKIRQQKINVPFSAIDVASTISNLLFTAYPSSNMGKPLPDIEK